MLKKASPHQKFICFKNWCNGWTTKRRTQQADQPCPLCEIETEKLTHIICCPAMWQPILDILQLDPYPTTEDNLAINDDEQPEITRLRMLALWSAFTVYHNLREYKGLTRKTIYDIADEVIRTANIRM